MHTQRLTGFEIIPKHPENTIGHLPVVDISDGEIMIIRMNLEENHVYKFPEDFYAMTNMNGYGVEVEIPPVFVQCYSSKTIEGSGITYGGNDYTFNPMPEEDLHGFEQVESYTLQEFAEKYPEAMGLDEILSGNEFLPIMYI